MTKPPIQDFEETRAGHRSGEGTESVMRHLRASARRQQKRRSEAPDSRGPLGDTEAGDNGLDIPLEP
jgi:hypothetical protein